MVAEWFASSNFADKLKGLEAIVQPRFPVHEAATQIRLLAGSVNHQARQFAAIAMGNGGAMFADDLALLVGPDQKTIVRTAAAHALLRVKSCPVPAIDGLAGMLALDSEPARKIAEAALAEGPPERFGAIIRVARGLPVDKLNLEVLSALAEAAKGRTGAADGISRWFADVAEQMPPVEVRMAVMAALARMTDGAQGVSALMTLIEQSHDITHRRLAMATLGSLGEIAAPCRERVLRALVSEPDRECEVLLYRLAVQLRTPAYALPISFLLRRIGESADVSLVAGACMLLTLGGRKFAEHAPAILARYEGADEALKQPLAVCYEKLAGQPIEPVPGAGMGADDE